MVAADNFLENDSLQYVGVPRRWLDFFFNSSPANAMKLEKRFLANFCSEMFYAYLVLVNQRIF